MRFKSENKEQHENKFPQCKETLFFSKISVISSKCQLSSHLHSKGSAMELEMIALTCYQLIIKYTGDRAKLCFLILIPNFKIKKKEMIKVCKAKG